MLNFQTELVKSPSHCPITPVVIIFQGMANSRTYSSIPEAAAVVDDTDARQRRQDERTLKGLEQKLKWALVSDLKSTPSLYV